MDRRILKTKKCLKDALHALLAQKPLEKITVTEICDAANTGRLTFYKYYTDKTNLLEDCFHDMQVETERRYDVLQKNNAGNSFHQSFLNLMDAIMDVAGRDASTIGQLFSNANTLHMYYQFVMDNLEHFEMGSGPKIHTKYDRKALNSFLIMGLWGFIYANGPDFDEKATRRKARMLINDLVKSDLFKSPPRPR
jgi:AcrR family transcriptional regulator